MRGRALLATGILKVVIMKDEFNGIEDASEEDQMELMEKWFRKHFENPAERTPYESAEGGYI